MPRARAPGRRAVNLLGGLLTATVGAGLLLLGGAWPGARVVLHLGVFAALLVAALFSERALRGAGHLPRWCAGMGALAAAMAAGLLPLPTGAVRLVAPARAADWPQSSWLFLSHDPEGTAVALAGWLAVAGFGAGVLAWAGAEGRRWQFERAILVLTAGLVATAGLHLVLDLEALFGVVRTSIGPGRAFFAPFVSRNHLGAVLLLVLPIVLGDAAAHRRGPGAIPRGILAVGVVTLLVLTHSPGIAGAAAVMGIAAAFGRWGWPALGVAVPAVATLALTAPTWAAMAAPWLEQSMLPRVRMWGDAVALARWSPIFGIGAGAFGEGIERVRTDCVARVWVHAHDVPLEWWLETGLVGLAAAVLAAALLWPGPARDSAERADRLTLGLIGLAAHNLVDFSLQLPAVAVLAAGVLAARIGAYGVPRAIGPVPARALLGALAILQLPAGFFAFTQAMADRAGAELQSELRDSRAATASAQRVAAWAPWRAEAALAEAWSAEAGGDAALAVTVAKEAAARFRGDPSAQRRLALVLYRAGSCAPALDAAARARALEPANWRNSVIDARISRGCGEPERMLDAWSRALTCQAPRDLVAEAYASFPLAVVWLDRLAGHPDRLRRLAAAADRAGEHDAAALAWDLASQHAGFENQLEQIEILIRAGRLADARAVFEEFRRIHPSHPRLDAIAEQLAAAPGGGAVVDLPLGPLAARLRAVEADLGAEAALAEAEREALLGNALDPALQYERARLHFALGKPLECRARIDAAGLASHPLLGEAARALRERCEGALQK